MSAEMRVMTIAAVGALLISALTGIFSHVAFGALLIRALLSGAGFAALSAGVVFIARKFLPEIYGAPSPADLSAEGGATAAAETPEPEHRLNIVLPGDGDDQPTEVENLPASAEPAFVKEADLKDFEREAEEIGTDSLVPRGEAENGEAPPATARPPATFEDLDVLPDLDGLSDIFSTAANGDIDAGEPPARDPISTTGASRDGVDAATMAQAVRTLLKRDQKG